MLGVSLLLQVNHLEVESKTKLWSRTPYCLWLAAVCVLMQVRITLSFSLNLVANTTVVSGCVLLCVSPLVSSSFDASFFFTPLDVVLGLQFLTLSKSIGCS